MATLEQQGLDASTVRFDEPTRRRTRTSPQAGGRDERFLDQVGSKWRLGVVVGALAGAVIGAVVGASLFGFEGRAALFAAVAFALGLGGAGAGLGVFVGGVWGQQQSGAWEETFAAPDLEHVTLLVEVSSDEELSLARAVLSEHSDDVQIMDDGGR